MGAREEGLTLEGLAQRLETLERENERMRSENAELRNEVTALKGSGTRSSGAAQKTRSLVPRRDEERSSRVQEGRVSRRVLLSRAGAAAAGLVVAGALTQTDIREAKAAQVIGDSNQSSRGAVEGTNTGINGYGVWGRASDGYGVRGEGRTGVQGASTQLYGVYGSGPVGVAGDSFGQAFPGESGTIGVRGRGDTGVEGVCDRDGWPGVYGRHDDSTVGPGVTGDGKGNWPGVWGRNPEADGVTGETSGSAKSGVYGRHNGGSSGFGVTGDGKGATGAGVLGRNAAGYGGRFEGGRAQLMLVPAGSTGRPGGAHARGEVYMDSAANLYVCVRAGTPGTWRKVATTAV